VDSNRPVRRVVTEEVEGISRVALDGPLSSSAHWHEIWSVTPESPLGSSSAPPVAPLEPPPGVIAWRYFEVPPDAVLAARHEPGPPSDEVLNDAEGFHQTASVDYIYIIKGEVSLRLDDTEVGLKAGDCVVQRATNHAWHNYGDEPAQVVGVMIGLGQESTE
jgi:mannose-6-phosphate isomerase-like protein (cupin superfamily)